MGGLSGGLSMPVLRVPFGSIVEFTTKRRRYKENAIVVTPKCFECGKAKSDMANTERPVYPACLSDTGHMNEEEYAWFVSLYFMCLCFFVLWP